MAGGLSGMPKAVSVVKALFPAAVNQHPRFGSERGPSDGSGPASEPLDEYATSG